ncbi:Outer-membrane lipoprotein carrier protein [Methylophilaceae bacterium]|nr:Outer-membrane lipoprotein carrier protein [Methylophilaceae bacterium]
MRLIFGIMLMMPLFANANGVDSLKAFFDKTRTMKAHFEQVVVDSQGKKVQEVTGTMQLLRPGKFRWDYNKPYVQEIVGDGERIWLHDPDLNQVTVRTLDKAIGASPAALLAGSGEIEKNFDLKDQPRNDKLQWVQVTPKDKDSGFDRVFLGFNKADLQKMELHDSYGHVTTIAFSKLERNPKLDAATFMFKPPAGADIVGE